MVNPFYVHQVLHNIKYDKTTSKTVPCKWCGELTPMLGTEECDRCWELRRRIEEHPLLAKKMIKGIV